MGRNSVMSAKVRWSGELPENNLKLGRSFSHEIGKVERKINRKEECDLRGRKTPGSVFARGLPVKHRKPIEIELKITRTSNNHLPRLLHAF